jgi:2-polyprenyl-6-methoxyphenol hydroxylase-like FAD-dependent oxidoreductase
VEHQRGPKDITNVRILIIGAGLGGLTAALSLHEAGLEVHVFEQAHAFTGIGAGINLLPSGTKELADLGLLSDLDDEGIRIREVIHTNRAGQVVRREPRGIDAGCRQPEFGIHRGRLHRVLYRAVLERLGSSRVHLGCTFTALEQRGDRIAARFIRHEDGQPIEATGDGLVGSDGIHSAVRAALYPLERFPEWTGITVWQGTTTVPQLADGRTMMVAGGLDASFVLCPIHASASAPGTALTAWAVLARLGRGGGRPPRREDWSRPGNLYEALAFTLHRFSLTCADPVALIESTRTFFEFPLCHRDPLPRWSFDRVTLLGDAAHRRPFSLAGDNAVTRAILDARALSRCLAAGSSVAAAFRAYEIERRSREVALVHAS